MKPATFRETVYALVRRIPAGRVATYGQIATLIRSPRLARVVGMALSALKYEQDAVDSVPWHRVINAAGKVSAPNDTHRYQIQLAMLKEEGIQFSEADRCDLARFRWAPTDADLDVGRQ